MLFGIENKTKELIGIKPEYENLDNRYFSSPIRTGIDGSIDFFFFTGKFLGKVIGFLYIAEAESKPTLIKIKSEDFIRGDIYYRYPAQTTKIEAADLRRIINEEIQKRLSKTLDAIQKVAHIGVDKLALLNTDSGEVDLITDKNTKIILNHEALKGLNIIKKGRLVDDGGQTAYTIKGDLDIELEESEFVEKHIPTLTKETEIYESFLSGSCEHPGLMLQQLLYHQSQYCPVYFFIHKAGITIDDAEELFINIDDRNVIKQTKEKILKRLKNSEYTYTGAIMQEVKHCFIPHKESDKLIQEVKTTLGLPSQNHEKQLIRTICLNTLKAKNRLPDDVYKSHLKQVIEAISHLDEEFIRNNIEFIISELGYIYHLDEASNHNSILRKTICNVDKALYEAQILQTA